MGCGAISKENVISPQQAQYQRLQIMNQTSQTIVYKCKNKTGELFCYKKYKNIIINQENYPNYLRFKNQAHRLKKLSALTTDLVRYQNVIVDQDKRLVLVMELIKQKTLKQCLQISETSVLSENDVSNYCGQILKVLKFLRQNGSIFCNIKCSNIFLSQDGKGIKLSDYHHMRQFFIQEVSDVIYMAPQNAKSKSYFKQTDIWRLGCIILQLITSKQPWLAYKHDQKQIYQKLASGMHPSLPKNISRQCNDILQKCFQILPSMRPSLNDLLNHSFFLKQSKSCQKSKKKITKKNPISKDNIQIQILESSPLKERVKNKNQISKNNQSVTEILRKSNISIKLLNDQNQQQRSPSARLFKKKRQSQTSFEISRPIRLKQPLKNNKYLKYLTEKNEQSPLRTNGIKSKQQILQLLQKKQKNRTLFQNQQEETAQNIMSKQSSKYKLAKKMSRTSNYRISKSSSKSKIKENSITLNNKKIISTTSKINQPNQSLHQYQNYSISIANPTNQLDRLIKQLGEQQNQNQDLSEQKYYKRPLRLLKKRLKYLKTAHTQTSIKDDPQTNQQSVLAQNYNQQNLLKNQSSLRLMTQQSHEEQIIDTAVSRAERNRYLAEQQVLRQQRQRQRLKWQSQLKQQKGIFQDRFSYRYQKKSNIAAQQILSSFNLNNNSLWNGKKQNY